MKTKHTPGPWSVDYQGEVRSDEGPVAEVKAQTESKLIANARLIAAAPEMLEALEYCVDFIQDIADKTRSVNYCLQIADFLNGYKDGINKKAAIRKAKGE